MERIEEVLRPVSFRMTFFQNSDKSLPSCIQNFFLDTLNCLKGNNREVILDASNWLACIEQSLKGVKFEDAFFYFGSVCAGMHILKGLSTAMTA